MKPSPHPDLFGFEFLNEVPASVAKTPKKPKAAAPAEIDALAKCADEMQNYTGLSFQASRQLVVAIIIAALCGTNLVVGGHAVRCAAAYLLTAYHSGVRLALTIAAEMIKAAHGAGPKHVEFRGVSSVDALCGVATDTAHVLAIGTAGPFHRIAGKSLASLDRMASAIRGQFGGTPAHFSTLWASSRADAISSIAVGNAVGFGTLITWIAVDSATPKMPTALERIQDLTLFGVVAALIAAPADGEPPTFIFTEDAVQLISAAVNGRDFWSDDLRKIASIAAALAVITEGVAFAVNADLAIRAIEMWNEHEAELGNLLGTEPPQPATVTENFDEKARRILDYWARNETTEMSPSNVVSHRLAGTVAEAKLLFAFLEMRGSVDQVQFIKNNRPFQKWVLRDPQSPPTPEDSNGDGFVGGPARQQ